MTGGRGQFLDRRQGNAAFVENTPPYNLAGYGFLHIFIAGASAGAIILRYPSGPLRAAEEPWAGGMHPAFLQSDCERGI
jgi:hypothetical protein